MSLHFFPLTYLEEGDEVVVGRTDTDSYGVFPPDGATLLRELTNGRPPDEAAAWYAQRYGTPVDIEAFLDTVRELGFVANEVTADASGAAGAASLQVRWQRLGQALFSPLAWACYITLVAATVTVCVAHPRFLPVPSHIFFSEYLLVIEVTLFLAQIPLCLLHETFHALAGRRLGLRTSIGVSRRLYFVVFETRLDGLVIVPRRQRYLPMLAGMLADVLTLCLFTCIAWLLLRPDGSLPLGGRLCLALAFTSVPGIASQFYFFLRTDIYYLITTVLGCVDLHTTAKAQLRNWFWALRGRCDRMVDASRWHPRDAAVARWYAPLYFVGYAAMVTMLLVMLPVTWRFFHTSIHTMLDAATPPARFWDAAVLSALNLFQLGFAGYMVVRDRRRARTRPS